MLSGIKVEVGGATQILQDWQTRFLVDIEVIDADKECPKGYDVVLYYDWGGLEDGCYHDGDFYGPREIYC